MLIHAATLRHIIERAVASGDEVCGVLLGHHAPLSVEQVIDGHNLDPAPATHYLLDAATLLHADARARASNLAIVGFYHSHPHGPGIPSPADRGAMWPGYVYLIAARSGTTPYLCAWLLAERGLLAQPIRPSTAPRT